MPHRRFPLRFAGIAATLGLVTLLLTTPPTAAAAPGWRWPVRGPVLTRFDVGPDPFARGQRRGITIAAPAGSTVGSACRGIVRFAGTVGDAGQTVSVACEGGLTATYLHLGGLAVRRGHQLAVGERVGTVGRSGRPALGASHLQFGVHRTGKRWAYVDPLSLLDGPAGWSPPVAALPGRRPGPTAVPPGRRAPWLGRRAPTPVTVAPPPVPEPVLGIAVVARTQADDDKLATALHRLVEEDPALVIERNDETHQTILRGMGETHLQITLEKLSRKFGVAVDTEDVRVAYRETITAAADAEGRHKKQSGGHGQFGVASIHVEPLERGEGFEFVDAIVGGAIPRQYIPAVEKGIEETMAEGGAHGFPVVDVKVTCNDGKYHPVDSSEMSFKMAGRLAFREAMAKASPVILEPISRLEVTVPVELQGEVMGDLNSRRARVQGTELADEGEQTVVALVPTSELRRYAIDLRSKTAGRGWFRMRHDHYDVLPANLVDQVAAEAHTG